MIHILTYFVFQKKAIGRGATYVRGLNSCQKAHVETSTRQRCTIVDMQVSWYTSSGLFDLAIIKLSKFVPRLSSAVQVVQGPRDTPVPNTKTAFKIVQGPSSITGPNTKADYMIVNGPQYSISSLTK